MPTQRDSRLRADERRHHRVLLLAVACSSTRSRDLYFASTACLVLWLMRRRDIHMSRGLQSRMLSKTFHLGGMTNYDVLSQMRFTKKHIRDIASFIPCRETTILGQVRTARRRYCASKEEALCVLLARLAMPSRVGRSREAFFRSKTAITEIFTRIWSVFYYGQDQWYLRSTQNSYELGRNTTLPRFQKNLRMQRSIALGSSTELPLRSLDRVACCKERPTADTRDAQGSNGK
jgi:hypothetical protein